MPLGPKLVNHTCTHGPINFIYTYILTYIHTYIHTYITYIHTFIHTYIHTGGAADTPLGAKLVNHICTHGPINFILKLETAAKPGTPANDAPSAPAN